MKKLTLFVVFAMTLASSSVQSQSASDPASNDADNVIVERLKRATQELLDAVAPGDVAVWRRYLAEGCLYTDEEGAVKTKEDLLKEFKPLPQGYVGSIKMGEPQVFMQDNVVVLSHRDRETLTLYGQTIITWFHMTDTWVREADGQWKLAAEQVMVIPNERKPVHLSPEQL